MDKDYSFIPKEPFTLLQSKQGYGQAPELYYQLHKRQRRYYAHLRYVEACRRMKETSGDLFAMLFWIAARPLLYLLDCLWRLSRLLRASESGRQ